MRLIHYSPIEIKEIEQREYDQTKVDFQSKPSGLWFSVEGPDDWKQWCKSEKFCLDRLRIAHEIKLKSDANILHLKTPDEITKFGSQYPFKTRGWDAENDTYQLEWNLVKKKYQGIIISPYQWDCRLALETSWYYGWDCSSGCIWDINCIESFSFLEEDLEMPTEPPEKPSIVKIVKNSLIDSAAFMVEDGHLEHEYAFCERTIYTSIQYLKGKREKQ